MKGKQRVRAEDTKKSCLSRQIEYPHAGPNCLESFFALLQSIQEKADIVCQYMSRRPYFKITILSDFIINH